MAKTWPLYTVGSFVISSDRPFIFSHGGPRRWIFRSANKGIFGSVCIRMDAVRPPPLARDGRAEGCRPKTLRYAAFYLVRKTPAGLVEPLTPASSTPAVFSALSTTRCVDPPAPRRSRGDDRRLTIIARWVDGMEENESRGHREADIRTLTAKPNPSWPGLGRGHMWPAVVPATHENRGEANRPRLSFAG